jgi:hypothetical protein
MTLMPVWRGHGDGCAVHDGRGGAFDGQTPSCRRSALYHRIGRPSGSMTRPSKAIAHGHIHDPARALDLVSCVEMPVIAQEHNANLIGVHVERQARDAAGKRHQFIKAHSGKTLRPWRCRWRRS